MRLVTWLTWEEPDRDVAVALHQDRGIRVVFPLSWAQQRTHDQLVAVAQERIAALERQTQRTLVAGSVLLAFSRSVPQPRERQIDPDVPRALFPMR